MPSKHVFLAMKRALFFLFFCAPFHPVFAQIQEPVFRLKKDSLTYQQLQQLFFNAIKNPSDRNNVDSIARIQAALLKDGVVRYRTIYRPSPTFTTWNELDTTSDLSTVTRLTLGGYQRARLPARAVCL